MKDLVEKYPEIVGDLIKAFDCIQLHGAGFVTTQTISYKKLANISTKLKDLLKPSEFESIPFRRSSGHSVRVQYQAAPRLDEAITHAYEKGLGLFKDDVLFQPGTEAYLEGILEKENDRKKQLRIYLDFKLKCEDRLPSLMVWQHYTQADVPFRCYTKKSKTDRIEIIHHHLDYEVLAHMAVVPYIKETVEKHEVVDRWCRLAGISNVHGYSSTFFLNKEAAKVGVNACGYSAEKFFLTDRSLDDQLQTIRHIHDCFVQTAKRGDVYIRGVYQEGENFDMLTTSHEKVLAIYMEHITELESELELASADADIIGVMSNIIMRSGITVPRDVVARTVASKMDGVY